MNEHDIDDRGLTPSNPDEPASPGQPDPVVCPECLGSGALASGETCPVCDGSGKASGRIGGG